jgi:cyclophilin family peptidyl-prolyl cis-trans isomerase
LREVQSKIEEAADGLQRFLTVNASQALGTAQGTLKSQKTAILKSLPGDATGGEELLAAIASKVSDANALIGKGEATVAYEKLESALADVSRLEEKIAFGYKQPLPPTEFAKLPYLKGRATVAFEFKRPGGKFDVDGTLYDKLNLAMVVDGYTAPITAGNFLDLVNNGFYNNFKIQRSDGFVVQTGDPKAEGRQSKNGYVPPGEAEVRKIPLEVYVSGDKQPIYGATFDDDGRGGYAAALPFNAYGALGMAREEYEVDSASSQFFWLLFDSDLTPAGKNLLDGRYACFGYTIDGARLLSDIKEGDVIVSAKVTSGIENLVSAAAPLVSSAGGSTAAAAAVAAAV